MDENGKFPGGSKSRVNRAGANIRARIQKQDDLDVIDEWRAAHRSVLNTFQSILRNRTKKTSITVAQRHKRKRTIFDKLIRLPHMELSRMDDVAGCRLIFNSIDELYAFRENFHKARFGHKRRNDKNKYDYIKKPKSTGYRGIHDIYEYNVRSKVGQNLAGLYAEIQYRTLVQHAWATTVEVIGFMTESQPKFQKGDNQYQEAMALASEILARAHEKEKGPFSEIPDHDLVDKFLALDQKLNLLVTLHRLKSADRTFKLMKSFASSEKRNAILIFTPLGKLEIKTYRDAPDAIEALFDLEKQLPEHDIVLVRADKSDDVRIAFKNYFSDANDFVSLIYDGCKKLASEKKLPIRKPRKLTQQQGDHDNTGLTGTTALLSI